MSFFTALSLLSLLVCANDISNGGSQQADGDCNMVSDPPRSSEPRVGCDRVHVTNICQVCNGNSTEFCGGPNRLNVYTKRAAPSGWQAIGCYTDSVAARTLASRQFPAGGMTTESCLAACRSAGNFIYAGTEYGGECVRFGCAISYSAVS